MGWHMNICGRILMRPERSKEARGCPCFIFFFNIEPDIMNCVYMTKSVTLAPLGPFLKCPTLITHDVLITFCDRLVNVHERSWLSGKQLINETMKQRQ